MVVWPHEWHVCNRRSSEPSQVAQRPVSWRRARGRWLARNELAQIYRPRTGSSQHWRLGTPFKRCPTMRPRSSLGGSRFGLGHPRNSSEPEPKSLAKPEGTWTPNLRNWCSPQLYGVRGERRSSKYGIIPAAPLALATPTHQNANRPAGSPYLRFRPPF